MRSALAAVAMMVAGCSSTYVTNVYVSDDASAETDADAGVDGDAAAETAGEAGDTRDPSFPCARTGDCQSGTLCCAVIGSDATGLHFVDSTACAPACILSSGDATPRACAANADCPASAATCCMDDFGHGWCAAKCVG